MEARIDNYSCWIAGDDPAEIRKVIQEMLIASGFGILNFMDHHFKPYGYTCIWLLAESHCAVHTFPEENKSYIELSSCNKQMYDDFLERIKAYQSSLEPKA
ncbi:MAG: S-adenosylmethionine decarboxylase [Bacteroidota bacterium]